MEGNGDWAGAWNGISVTDVATQQVVLNVEYNTVQTNNQDMSTLLCLTSSKYMIDIGSRSVNWAFNSYLYVNAILFGDEYETIARIRYDSRVACPRTARSTRSGPWLRTAPGATSAARCPPTGTRATCRSGRRR